MYVKVKFNFCIKLFFYTFLKFMFLSIVLIECNQSTNFYQWMLNVYLSWVSRSFSEKYCRMFFVSSIAKFISLSKKLFGSIQIQKKLIQYLKFSLCGPRIFLLFKEFFLGSFFSSFWRLWASGTSTMLKYAVISIFLLSIGVDASASWDWVRGNSTWLPTDAWRATFVRDHPVFLGRWAWPE